MRKRWAFTGQWRTRPSAALVIAVLCTTSLTAAAFGGAAGAASVGWAPSLGSPASLPLAFSSVDTATASARSFEVSVRVAQVVVRPAHPTMLSGVVAPIAPGKKVTLQIHAGEHWRTVATRSLSRSSRFSFVEHLTGVG